ncbi:3-ketosteroid-delta-1-dehydrogenase [Streptomyces avermitilis]|nr:MULTISPECIES: 3-oxosteroid 1-dehydrogenase [Streptomyces]KUN54997.1 3-ketosteroid-delta-1-dehydrogenase [Streptomyces avermitilis]MYS97222.1 3-oxosteroid 1-dehydrogenase [Streptomyces sp. SID5469]OOV25237.1 3-ketosteroid-delta-1-dehydrogenase [Streptomyces avermitilis]GDY61316.1 3-ketosteroid-delta-1-dehydrogenase [Streptomyces avermitilis]GDY78591.1 3-ketosteroid-delta-1-dehydrogenase [Streptomyces avermitilis]
MSTSADPARRIESLSAVGPSRRRVLGGTGAGLALAAGLPGVGGAADAADLPLLGTYDVVVIGSGAAGMTAALTAAKQGLSCVVVEKAATFGGSAARSGAGIWIPNNPVILAAGVPDTPAKAAAYLAAVVGPDVSADRQRAFLGHGPAMISFVMANSPLRFRWMEGYSDYYPELSGGLPNGRSIEPDQLDGNILGAELAHLNPSYMAVPAGMVVFSADYKWLTLSAVSAKGLAVAAECLARGTKAALLGQKPLTMGQSLAAGLRAGLLAAQVPVWLNTPLTDLYRENGTVTGAVVAKGGSAGLVRARHGVVVGSGGFEHNAAMRDQYQRQPIGTAWTVGAKENTGDGIRAGERAGAALDLMDDAWWGPTIPLPDQPYFCLAERTLPGGLLVNAAGARFVNEAAPYSDVVHTMYERNPTAPDIPAWLIVDQNYRNRYLFKDVAPTLAFPGSWYDSGAAHKAWTLDALAGRIGMPAAALRATVNRFNSLALSGDDTDFQRGDSTYDHYYTDPAIVPNSCLAPLWLAPYYAFKIVPGDLGTKGGLRTDARARVLRADGSVIPGLYAAGNASAAVMGHSYAGAGSTIGPAMTFGYIAALDIAAAAGS